MRIQMFLIFLPNQQVLDAFALKHTKEASFNLHQLGMCFRPSIHKGLPHESPALITHYFCELSR